MHRHRPTAFTEPSRSATTPPICAPCCDLSSVTSAPRIETHHDRRRHARHTHVPRGDGAIPSGLTIVATVDAEPTATVHRVLVLLGVDGSTAGRRLPRHQRRVPREFRRRGHLAGPRRRDGALSDRPPVRDSWCRQVRRRRLHPRSSGATASCRRPGRPRSSAGRTPAIPEVPTPSSSARSRSGSATRRRSSITTHVRPASRSGQN